MRYVRHEESGDADGCTFGDKECRSVVLPVTASAIIPPVPSREPKNALLGSQPGVVCAQIGSREHYTLPRALYRADQLSLFYTDTWASRPLRTITYGPLRRLADRFHPELPPECVHAFNTSAIVEWSRDRLMPARGVAATFHRYLSIGQGFGIRVARHMAASGVRPLAFIGYNTGCLEPIRLVKSWGVPAVVGQIDPGRTEEELVHRESDKWPGWAALPGRIPDEYYARLASEWGVADRVIVNSEWSRAALVAQGVPTDKLSVIPLAYDPPPVVSKVDRHPSDRLTVLWLGQVILRKGIQYLIAAARLIPRIRIVVVGPIGISPNAIATAPGNVEFVGPVPRSQANDYYRLADVFVLPTLSDGFALTQLEAMAHGLPVVTTPNCGEVVTDGVDGLIVPAGDAEKLAEALDTLAADPHRREEMGRRARETAGRFSLDRFAARLVELITALGQPAGKKPL